MRRLIVQASTSIDPAKALVGSSPSAGDQSSVGIVLPANATPSQDRRYLCRLCGFEMSQDEYCVIRSVELLLTIGAYLDVGDQQDPTQYPLEIPVTDPSWSFPDGNVSWHMRRVRPGTTPASSYYSDFVFNPPFASDRDGLTSAILARVPRGAAYLPLNAGQPYGDPIGSLGTMRDLRFPWGQRYQNLDERVDGLAQVVLFASVHQTDPDTRVQPPVAADGTYLRREDRFVMNHPTARYWRVCARMRADIFHRDEIAERQ